MPLPSSARGGAALAAALALLAGGAELASAQYPNPGPSMQPETVVPGTSQSRPRFSVDAAVEPGTGTPVVRLDYRLARSELLFERRPTGYHAAYELRVIFYRDKGDRQVAGDIFVRELAVRTYAETRPIGADIIDHVDLPVPPGKYDVRVIVNDLKAERMSGTEIEIDVPAQPTGQVWFTDLSFGTASRTRSDTTNLRANLDLTPARRYAENLAALAVYGELADARPEPPGGERYQLDVRILNEAQDRVFQRDTTIVRRGTRTPFLLTPGIASLAAGSYRFIVELKSPPITTADKRRQPIRREKTFDVLRSTATIAADPRSTFEVLRIIADPEERSEMDRLDTDAKRQEFWERFWRRRDPTPDTPYNEKREEFYQRVAYANQNFSVGTQGWATDMGRVYIVFGQPDEIVRSPFNFDRPPEEIWHYYQQRKTFTFIDRRGFGLYELDPDRNP